MKHRMIISPILACLMITIVVPAPTATAQGQSPSNPLPVGEPINSEVQCGDNAVSLEPYDLKITVLQTVRGKEAWELIRAASTSNNPSKLGFDYILARIRFELKAKIAPGNKSFELGRPFQLSALSPDGRVYETPSVMLPKPELSGKIRSGESAEGWVAFLVEQGEGNPLMAFDPSSGGGMLRGRVLFFKLH